MVDMYQQSENDSVEYKSFGIKNIINSLDKYQRVCQDITIMTRIVIKYAWSRR